MNTSDKFVSFSQIGKLGRMGNQFFQFAAMYAYSRRHNIPMAGNWICNYSQRNYGQHFDLVFTNFIGAPAYSEPGFEYTEIPAWDKIDLVGYFQSELYFQDYANEIKTILRRGENSNNGKCSIHVRLGDYLNLPDYHPIQSKEYYTNAINEMTNRGATSFTVFSDDIPACRNMFGNNVEYREGFTDLQDMEYMASHEYHIIANSSFSWWGAWLSNSKNVIAPLNWFGYKGPQNTSTLYPKTWTIM